MIVLFVIYLIYIALFYLFVVKFLKAQMFKNYSKVMLFFILCMSFVILLICVDANYQFSMPSTRFTITYDFGKA